MPPIERIVIEVNGDPSKLKSTLDSLENLGVIDKKNRESFEKTGQAHKKVLKETHDEAGKLSEQFTELGNRFVAAFAVEKIIEFGTECIKAFEEAEKASNKLKFAVENINNGGAQGFKELTEQSETLSASLNNLFSPKQIQQSQAQLAQAKISTEQILKVMPLILDVAAKSGDSIETVTTKFVNATEIGGKGLKEYGGKFTDLGDKVKNLDRAMEELKGFTGGAADAMGDAAAQAQMTTNKLEVLSESIGSKLAPAWEGFKLLLLEGVSQALGLGESIDELIAKMDAAGLKKTQKELEESDFIKNSDEKTLLARKKFVEGYIQENRKLWLLNGTLKSEAGVKAQEENMRQIKQDQAEVAAIEAVLERRKEAAEKEKQLKEAGAQSQEDLTKLTIEELNRRNKALKDGGDAGLEIYKNFNDKGRQVEENRIEKELARRKAANDKLIEMQKQFEITLLALKEAIANEEAKASIDLIRNNTEKQIATEDDAFRQKQVMIENQRRKLNEIIAKGNEEQRSEAKLLLTETYKEEELDEQAHQLKLQDIIRESNEKILDMEKEAKISQLNFQNDYEAAIEKSTEISLKAQLDKKEITQQQYDVRVAKMQIEAAKQRADRINQEDQIEIRRAQEKIEALKKAGLDASQAEKELDDAVAKANLDRINGANAVAEAENRLTEATMTNAEKQTKVIQGLFEVFQTIAEAISTTVEQNIAAINALEQRQESRIQTQRVLAEQGLENTLAFEERKADELEKRRLDEERKAKKAAELKIFLTALAKFAEDNPNTALGKALGLLAATKVAEAVFGEEGGLIGDPSMKRYRWNGSNTPRHKSGKDVLLHAEVGERLLSVEQTKKFDSLGGLGLLKRPLNEKQIPTSSFSFDSDEIGKHIREAIKQIPIYNMNLLPDQFGMMIEKTTDGLKERIVHELKKPKGW